MFLLFQVSKKILDFIVDGNLSFNVSQLPSLRILLETVSGRKVSMPSRHKFMLTLDAEFEAVKKSLKELLAKQQYLCVTTDVWSSHAQSYLGVTVHFIDSSYERHSYMLAFKQLKSRQTYDVLANALDAVFEDYGILKSQITNIVTDGGSSFCKMFKKYGDSIDVVVVDTDGDPFDEEELEDDENSEQIQNDDSDTVQPSMTDDRGDEFYSEIITLDIEAENGAFNENRSDDDVIQNYLVQLDSNQVSRTRRIELPAQRRCVSHILNLISKDFEKNLDGFAKTAHQNTFDALHTLWSITRNSSNAKTICKEILGVVLKFPTATRWNSKFDCVKI